MVKNPADLSETLDPLSRSLGCPAQPRRPWSTNVPGVPDDFLTLYELRPVGTHDKMKALAQLEMPMGSIENAALM